MVMHIENFEASEINVLYLIMVKWGDLESNDQFEGFNVYIQCANILIDNRSVLEEMNLVEISPLVPIVT